MKRSILILFFFILCLLFIVTRQKQPTYIYLSELKNGETTYKFSNTIIEINQNKNVNQTMANFYTTWKLKTLYSIFEDHVSPYPGQITNKVSCDFEFFPINKSIIINNETIEYIQLYTNDRLSYGVCTNDQISYISLIRIMYCNAIEDYGVVEIFIPVSEFNSHSAELLSSIKCHR